MLALKKGAPLFKSNFTYGITYTHHAWEHGAEMIKPISKIQNQHIMGWGAGNPWPAKDAPMDFSSLDNRMAALQTMGGEIWLTLCQAPGWMKGGSEHDWAMEKCVLEEYEDDFAHLCAEIAKRYPQVTTFQVWNEFKGYMKNNKWDYVGYTRIYNKVYKAVKQARPDAIIGGFYMVFEGDGTQEEFGLEAVHSYTPLSDFQREATIYWRDHCTSADYFLLDRGVVDYHNYTQPPHFKPSVEQLLHLTKYYKKVTEELTELVDLPIVYSEFYGDTHLLPPNSHEEITAVYASIYYNMIMGAKGRELKALLWLETETEFVNHAIFTPDGEALPHYHAVKKLVDNFPHGTQLYNVETGTEQIEAFASDRCFYVINKSSSPIDLEINGKTHTLQPFGVEIYG